MKHITENFLWAEAQCRCGCVMPDHVKVNMEKVFTEIEVGIRSALDLPVEVNSAYRCENHNAIVGGAPNSKHVRGEAVDLVVRRKHGLIAGQWLAGFVSAQILAGKMREGGVGTYSGSRRNVLHYDIGSDYPRRWHHG